MYGAPIRAAKGGFGPDIQAAMQAGAQGQILNPEAEQAPEGTEQIDEQIRNAYEQLNTMMTQNYPDVDFSSRYKELIDEVQNRPEPQQVHPAAQFAFAMGSPDKAPAILHERMGEIDKAHSKKEEDLLRLKEDLLNNSIKQEVQKGNFKMALKQSEQLAEIQRLNADRERAKNMADWKEKQKTKTADAKTLINKRVQALADNFHLDEKMKLALVNHGMSLIQSLAGKTDMFGESTFNESATTDLVDRVFPSLYEFAKNASKKPEETKDEPKTNTPPAAATKETPLQKAIRESREAKAKK